MIQSRPSGFETKPNKSVKKNQMELLELTWFTLCTQIENNL